MAFFSRKESALDRRLKALDKELAKVQGSLKAAARSTHARAAPAAESGESKSAHDAAKINSSAMSDQADAKPKTEAPTDTFFSHLPKSRSAQNNQTQAEPDLFNQSAGNEDAAEHSERRRFASYFMAGHFHDLRPIRHEKRVQRNKAIVSVIVTLLVLAWLLYWVIW